MDTRNLPMKTKSGKTYKKKIILGGEENEYI